MADATIGGVELDFIVDTIFSEMTKAPVSSWVNSDVEIQDTVWSKDPLVVVYVVRTTSEDKWNLESLMLAVSSVALVDSIYTLNETVVISSIKSNWEGDINWSRPWRLEIEMIVT